MDLQLVLGNLLSPPILLFLVGALAALLKSDLTIPEPIPRLLSLYLLWAIGFKGGVGLAHSGLTPEISSQLLAAIGMSIAVPLYTFFPLRKRLGASNAAAIAATYGSVSAVTFVTAAAFLERRHEPYGGHMVAALALMESPAIIVALLLHRRSTRGDNGGVRGGHILRESFLNGAVFLLLGSLAAGWLTGDRGMAQVKPFAVDIFPGVLSFFLLDMGLVAARRLRDLGRDKAFLVAFAIVVPLVNAAAAIAIAAAMGMGRGDALLFVVLSASASYIAVPAAIRMAVPDASPSIFVPMALAITFPFNITVGLPLYAAILDRVLPAAVPL